LHPLEKRRLFTAHTLRRHSFGTIARLKADPHHSKSTCFLTIGRAACRRDVQDPDCDAAARVFQQIALLDAVEHPRLHTEALIVVTKRQSERSVSRNRTLPIAHL